MRTNVEWLVAIARCRHCRITNALFEHWRFLVGQFAVNVECAFVDLCSAIAKDSREFAIAPSGCRLAGSRREEAAYSVIMLQRVRSGRHIVKISNKDRHWRTPMCRYHRMFDMALPIAISSMPFHVCQLPLLLPSAACTCLGGWVASGA